MLRFRHNAIRLRNHVSNSLIHQEFLKSKISRLFDARIFSDSRGIYGSPLGAGSALLRTTCRG